MLRHIGLVALLLLSSACKKTEASATASKDAAAPIALSASASAPPVKAPKEDEVDLLYVTRSVMAVSSKVDNPKDYPEHLVDRDVKTAWNSKTGDLVGAWIAFRVPKDVTVKRLEIIVGFDKIAKDGTDLFTANHRIKKVEVTRDGTAIGTFDLDPEKRTLQSIRIDGPGGEYRVKVLETAPGTKKEWRELTVSEFHVIGTTPHLDRMGGEQPKVFIGTLDPPVERKFASYSEALKAFFPSAEAFCETQKKLVDLTPDDTARLLGCPTNSKARCSTSPAPKIAAKLKPPFLDIANVSYDESTGSVSTYLLKTAKGWRRAEELGAYYSGECTPGCPMFHQVRDSEGIELASSSVPALLIKERFATYYQGGPDHIVTRIVSICRLGPDEGLSCDKPVGINERIEVDTSQRSSGNKTEPWKPDIAYVVTPDGKIERKGDFESERDESWPKF